MFIMIFTHQYPDLDAVACVWFCLRFFNEQPVVFKPAFWDGVGAGDKDWVVDMDCGYKGERDADGVVHACFTGLVERYATAEDKKALAGMTHYIDLQDSQGDVYRALGIKNKNSIEVLSQTDLLAIFRALQTVADNDAFLLQQCLPLFDALLAQGRNRQQAQQEASDSEWVGEVAIKRNAKSFNTMDVLFSQGAKAVVYRDGFNIGVVRAQNVSMRMDAESIKQLVAGEAGWFFHPAGFMCCRGGRKAPMTEGSCISPLQLATVVNDLLFQNTEIQK